ncbi:MAG: hypothetical protein EVA89_09200 [Sandaracinaceae bacterium]|nr:MAG: hypothetical protein EVA89_09200 [Sandaracinaceae bacterium]
MDHHDLSTFIRPKRFDGLTGVFLARALLEVTPEDADERLLREAARVRTEAEHIRLTLIQRRHQTPAEVGKWGSRVDDGWMAIDLALESKTRLAPSPSATRATELRQEIFPDGTGFVRLPGKRQWSHSDLLLQRIDDAGLAAELDALLGPEYLAYLRPAHEAYGRALGLGRDANDTPESDALRDNITSLSYAIAEYCRILVGQLVRGDEASEARFRRAVGPLAAHLEATARRRAAGEEPEEPTPEPDLDEPLPDVDAPPPVVDDPPVPLEA